MKRWILLGLGVIAIGSAIALFRALSQTEQPLADEDWPLGI